MQAPGFTEALLSATPITLFKCACGDVALHEMRRSGAVAPTTFSATTVATATVATTAVATTAVATTAPASPALSSLATSSPPH